jgi:hypothetical protein
MEGGAQPRADEYSQVPKKKGPHHQGPHHQGVTCLPMALALPQ